MADDGFRIELNANLGARLEEAARAAGLSADEYASELISQALDDDGWNEARKSLAHYDRTGASVDAEEAMAAAKARLMARIDAAR